MPINLRVRDNNVFGTVEDDPLVSGATAMNSSGLSTLSTIAAKHATITLDPLHQFGNPEIIIVTTHTASSTIITMTRGAYGTTPRAHPRGTLWVHAALNEDFISIVSSTTRPTDPYEGQFIYEIDTNKLVGYGGVDWAPRDAGGQIGYAQAVASQLAITTATDLTNLSVSVTVGTGRRIRITGFCAFDNQNAGANTGHLEIRESGVTLNRSYTSLTASGTVGEAATANVGWVGTPSTGPHTYNLRANALLFNIDMFASSTLPAFILVEDIGAA